MSLTLPELFYRRTFTLPFFELIIVINTKEFDAYGLAFGFVKGGQLTDLFFKNCFVAEAFILITDTTFCLYSLGQMLMDNFKNRRSCFVFRKMDINRNTLVK